MAPARCLPTSAIVNGVYTAPIMAVMLWIGQFRRAMISLTISGSHRMLGRAGHGRHDGR